MNSRVLYYISIGSLALAFLGGTAVFSLAARDAKTLRTCRLAKSLAEEYRGLREHIERVGDDEILVKIMDRDFFRAQIESYDRPLTLLRRSKPRPSPELGRIAKSDSTDLHSLGQQMWAWQLELERNYICPSLLLPERFIGLVFKTVPPVAIEGVKWRNEFAGALQTSQRTAKEQWADVRQDTTTLCRSRDALANAQVIHDHLTKRCQAAPAKGRKPSSLNCKAPLKRSSKQIDDLNEVVRVNETKFTEKWSPWLKSTKIQCTDEK